MDLRKYNIYFHTHTISGIIIAALLYVIFFAGSFSFFRDDITAWQKGRSAVSGKIDADYNFLMDSLARNYNLRGRDFGFYLLRQGHGTYLNMSSSKDTTISKPRKEAPARGRGRRGGDSDSAYFLYHFTDKKPVTYTEGYDMGEFLYRLHFLAQLNQVPIRIGTPFGYLLAGIVSFLFLFALITGLLLHWDKIVSNFFIFRPWSKWKTVWTDMHTALGVIGFPFQFVFAVTGIVLIVNFVLISPFTRLLYNGDQEKVYEELEYNIPMKAEYSYRPLAGSFNLNAFVSHWQNQWGENPVTRINIINYLDSSMQVLVTSKPDPAESFAGSGYALVDVASGKVLQQKSPVSNTRYIDRVKSVLYHLHFGDFGGKPLRIVFFLLGLTGCLVIISGIVIWLVARDKTATPRHKRVFNFWASNFFLAACLSMLPVTAFTFIMIKALDEVNQSVIYDVYFYSWLILGIFLMAWRNLPLMNKITLGLSAALCLGVPLANGFCGGLWMWDTYIRHEWDIFFIDALFLALSAVCGFALWRVKRDARPFKIIG
ncbi:PepSY-associated TM helix domain-containing protein [Leadbetterella sp. DM7]|uniref:PepSY-associated TM helix domain-containing protein n=1 Tax=Leadbetterella sp. DM7 TaxID=3235085 RepID=UPI00349EF067